MTQRTSTYDDETVEAMARAHYERQASGPGVSVQMKWATWEEACRCDGFLEEKLACMKAALAAIPQPPPPADDAEWVLVPREPGPCEGDDSGWLLTFMYALHVHLPEDERPTAWMQFSDEQRMRIRNAWRLALAAAPTPPFTSDTEGKL